MSDKTDSQISVSDAYQMLPSAEPPAEVDQLIRQSARDELLRSKSSFRKYFIPLSVAASVVLLSAVLVNLLVVVPQHDQAAVGLTKQPMYMMQRSKPPAPEVMISQLELLVQNNSLDEATMLHQKFRSFYPQYPLSPELTMRLQQHNIPRQITPKPE